MFLNYLKLAVRLLIRNPFFTLINVLGLSVGFASFYILWPYTQSELHSDRFHHGHEQIALLSWHHRWTDNNQDWNEFQNAFNFCGIGRHIADEFSEVKDLTRIIPLRNSRKNIPGIDGPVFFAVYKNDSVKEFYQEENAAYADPNFLQFFSFPLLHGDPVSVLTQPYSVVISRKHSLKYFGTTSSVNSTIYVNDSIPLKVTGVFEDLPRNTHFKFDLLITTAGIDDIDLRFDGFGVHNWMGANYIKTNEGVKFTDLEQEIDTRRKELYNYLENADPTVSVVPLKDVVFKDFIESGNLVNKSKNPLLILKALSFVILFLAWANYIGLSITTLHKRLPEVGTRKVVGARNRDFAIQFLVESAIINFTSLLLALTIVQLVKAAAEYLFHFYIADWKTIFDQHLTILLVAPVAGIIVTGFYPMVISAKKEVVSLLKKLRTVQMPWWINSLVTIQYASAVVLLIWIGTVYFQLDYILNKDTGVNPEGILVVDYPLKQKKDFNHQLDYFVHESLIIQGIQQASLSKSVVGDYTGIPFFVQRSANSVRVGLFSNGMVDENFLDLYGIQLLEGRNFLSNHPADQKSVLLSRVAVERLGFSSLKECIGARIILPNYSIHDVEITGVYDDYEFEPYLEQAQKKGRGSILTYKNSLTPDIDASKISFKINLENASSIIAKLEELYKATFPLETFKWMFLDQNINRHYAQEQIARNQITLFTLLAIGISCLGLLGTTSNKVIEKTKEIGIRKVLGAKMYQIAQIILHTTARQVIMAIAIGIPMAYYLVREYLERYSERLSFQWWHYALPVALLLLVMFITIAGVLVKAARTNPVDSLRSE